jgi:arylformamidase
MRIHDVSLPISQSLVTWPGDPPVRITRVMQLAQGDEAEVSEICLCSHAGTHIDAPRHFFPDGVSVDKLDLRVLIGPAWVCDAGAADALTPDVMEQLAIPPGTARVLFKTRNSELWARGEAGFREHFVAIPEDGARWLAEREVRLVGVDYLSVGPFASPDPTHRVLLGAGIVCIEGLDLSAVAAGEYQLICLPLMIVGGDGAPARAVLLEHEA